MLSAQYKKIEQLDAAHKSNQVHARIRQATRRNQSACVTTCIEDKDGNIIMEQDKILARWQEYISELYDDNSSIAQSVACWTLTSSELLGFYPQCG